MGCGSSQPHSQEPINFLKSALKSRRTTVRSPIIILPPPITPDCPVIDLFEDKDFICQNSVIYGPNGSQIEIQWLRPHELVSKPALYVDGTSRRDVIQGILGDCWLLSTCAALAKKVSIIH